MNTRLKYLSNDYKYNDVYELRVPNPLYYSSNQYFQKYFYEYFILHLSGH